MRVSCMVEEVSAGGQPHHDIECKSEGESSDDSVVTKGMYHLAVDLGQSLVPDNAFRGRKMTL